MPSFDTETAELVGESIARSTETLCVEESKLQYSDTEESDKQSEKASEETVSEEAPSEESSEEASEETVSEESTSEQTESTSEQTESASEQSEEEEEIVPPTPSSTPAPESAPALVPEVVKNATLETIQTAYCHCSNCIKDYAVIAHDIFTEHPRQLRVSYCAHMMSTLHYAMSKSKEAMCATVHAFFPFVFAHVDELELHQIYDKEKQE